jgi:pyruvate formate lyase activating enzyme
VDNPRIKANYQRAYETFPQKTFIARTPVIPGVNDDEEHIRAVLAFIRPYRTSSTTSCCPTTATGSKCSFLGRVCAPTPNHPLR